MVNIYRKNLSRYISNPKKSPLFSHPLNSVSISSQEQCKCSSGPNQDRIFTPFWPHFQRRSLEFPCLSAVFEEKGSKISSGSNQYRIFSPSPSQFLYKRFEFRCFLTGFQGEGSKILSGCNQGRIFTPLYSQYLHKDRVFRCFSTGVEEKRSAEVLYDLFNAKTPKNSHPDLSDGKSPIKSEKNIPHAFARKDNVDRGLIRRMVEVIRDGENGGIYSSLNSVCPSVSASLVVEVFKVLNKKRLRGLHFFNWARDTNPSLYRADVCSLAVNNCGRLGDYVTMKNLLKAFREDNICLSKEAFGFLTLPGLSKDHVMESIRRVVGILNETKGSCRNSGVFAMVEMFSAAGSFEMAKFVISNTERKAQYYNVMIREKCRRGNVEEAQDIIEEMRGLGCVPDAKMYNYMLGGLCKRDKLPEACKMLEDMVEKKSPPDSSTYDILIFHSCRLGLLDISRKLLENMVHGGLEPQGSTHFAFVKGYFEAEQFEEAHNYVRALRAKHSRYTNTIYGVLASLYEKKEQLSLAQGILVEMLDEGLTPNYATFKKIVNQLLKTGDKELVLELQDKFSRLRTGGEN